MEHVSSVQNFNPNVMTLYYNLICCTTCNKGIKEGIANGIIFPNLIAMLSPFVVLCVIILALNWFGKRRHLRSVKLHSRAIIADPVPLTTTAIILGIGIGGFIDGILLHQLLQWHGILSAKIPATDYIGKSVNMFWDGIFHFFCLLVVLIGLVRMWQLNKLSDLNLSGKLLAGGGLIGWAIFNLVEGMINHHMLKLHNVIEQTPTPERANVLFLVSSVVLLFIGLFMVNSVGAKIPRNIHEEQT